MAEQYFEREPASKHRPAEFRVAIRGHSFTFRTDAGVFSRTKLDRGTELLLESLDVRPSESILDLGCGYGAIGIVAARLTEGGCVVLTDVNERAVGLARANVEANRILNAEVRVGPLYAPVERMDFDHIVSNPPIRAGRATVDRIIAEAPAHLLPAGSLWLVARTRQGADAIRSRMAHAFGDAAIVKRGSGFKVLRSVKPGGPTR
jgi:16S rRNA (guanine1207-N2)-methyltransferase